MATAEIRQRWEGRHVGKVWNALFAAAIARAMGSSLDQVRQGLRSFKPDMADSEGRFSIIDGLSFDLIVDPVDGPESAKPCAGRSPDRGAGPQAGPGEWPPASGSMASSAATGRAVVGAFDVCLHQLDERHPTRPAECPRLRAMACWRRRRGSGHRLHPSEERRAAPDLRERAWRFSWS